MLASAFYIIATVLMSESALLCYGMFACLLLYYYKHKVYALYVLAGGITTALATTLLKHVFMIERPASAVVEVGGYAFPSGHAASAMFFVTAMYLLFFSLKDIRTRMAYYVGGGAVVGLVGYSRVFLMVHEWYQVFAGYLLGLMVALVAYYAIVWRTRKASGASTKNNKR